MRENDRIYDRTLNITNDFEVASFSRHKQRCEFLMRIELNRDRQWSLCSEEVQKFQYVNEVNRKSPGAKHAERPAWQTV